MIDRLCPLQRLIYRLAAISYWEWRRREVRCSLNVVCRAFRERLFAGGLFGCLVCVNCTDTRVSIPSFGGFSLLLLSALAGVHKSVISAGGNSELNSITRVIVDHQLRPPIRNQNFQLTIYQGQEELQATLLSPLTPELAYSTPQLNLE